MTEQLSQWAADFLPSIALSLTLWALGAAAVGFVAGIVIFILLRLIGIYRMKFKLGGVIVFLLFCYTVFVTTVAFGFIGFFESVKRQTDEVLASPENQRRIGELSGAITSRATALAYSYGLQAQSSGNTEPDFPALIQKLNSFDKDQWGIDLSKSDAAFDQITDEVIQQNYESLYQLVFKDVTGEEGNNLSLTKGILDRFVKPEKLTGEAVTRPLRNTLAEIAANRTSASNVNASEIKTYAGAKTSDFLTNKFGFTIRAQQIFVAIFAGIAMAIPIFLAIVLKLIVRAQAKPAQPAQADPTA